jgi:hypothetical protein
MPINPYEQLDIRAGVYLHLAVSYIVTGDEACDGNSALKRFYSLGLSRGQNLSG